jgi:hypothetical protein
MMIFAPAFTLFAFPGVRTGGAAAIQTMNLFSLDIPLAVILYVLLRDVDRNLALLAAFLRAANAVFGSQSVLRRIVILLLFGSAVRRHLPAAYIRDSLTGLYCGVIALLMASALGLRRRTLDAAPEVRIMTQARIAGVLCTVCASDIWASAADLCPAFWEC